MAKQKGVLVIIAAPGGTGKGTIIKKYLETHDAKLSISYTSRKKRPDDSEGSYYFVDRAEFERMISNGEFLEYVEFCGNYYGTPKSFVLENIEKNNDVILELDYVGALRIKEKFQNAVLIFILPPSLEELKNRLIKRGGDTPERICERLNKAKEEVNNAKYFDYLIINDKLEDTLKSLEAIINVEKNIKACTKEEIQRALDCKVDLEKNKNKINEFIEQLENM